MGSNGLSSIEEENEENKGKAIGFELTLCAYKNEEKIRREKRYA